jgi:hypothetical protein
MPVTQSQLAKIKKLLTYSDRYEISIQFWPKQTAVFISKDFIDLNDFGGDTDFAIDESIKYLDRINRLNICKSHKKCDLCGNIITAYQYVVYDENFKKQDGLIKCGNC